MGSALETDSYVPLPGWPWIGTVQSSGGVGMAKLSPLSSETAGNSALVMTVVESAMRPEIDAVLHGHGYG